MTFPSLLLGIVLSTLYGAAFHLWRGGSLGKLLLYLLLGWIGFWAGHITAESLGWSFDKFGPLHIGAATIGSIVVLGIGYWLSLVEVQRRQ